MREPDDWIEQDTILTPFFMSKCKRRREDYATAMIMKIKYLMVLFAILLIGICSVSCSDENEPTMEVAYDSFCNESVKIMMSEDCVVFFLNYNVAGMVISNNRNDLEDMDVIGYAILKNYYKNEGFRTPELMGNVVLETATWWDWYFDPNHYTNDAPYTHAERNTTYYYRLFSFGYGRECGNYVNLWLDYGDIAEFTTPQ